MIMKMSALVAGKTTEKLKKQKTGLNALYAGDGYMKIVQTLNQYVKHVA